MIEFHHVERYQGPQEPSAPAVLCKRDHLVERLRGEVRGDPSDETIQNRRQTKNEQEHEEESGDETMFVTKRCVDDMAPIELANRDQVHGSHE